MAKVTYFSLLGPNGNVADLYDASIQLQAGKSSSTQVVFKDTGVGSDKIVISGTGLAWEGDSMTAGTITGINFTAKEGAPYMTFKGLSIAVDDFNDVYEAEGTEGLAELLMSRADQITGSKIADDIGAGGGADLVRAGGGADTIEGGAQNDKLYGEAGNDYIFGGTGSDRMWGGAGSDRFHFAPGNGKDFIMDFDATGGGKKQDYLSLYADAEFDVRKANHGRDTVLDFHNGDTLTLVGVTRSEFSRTDDIDWLAI